MKYKNKKLEPRSTQTVVIPRNGENIIITVQAVNMKECPLEEPKIPLKMRPGQPDIRMEDDPDYIKEMAKYNSQRGHWMILKSLAATPDLEFETVDMTEPTTWGNYIQELEDSGFSAVEVNNILMTITDVCGFSQEKIDAATKSFLAGRAKEPVK